MCYGYGRVGGRSKYFVRERTPKITEEFAYGPPVCRKSPLAEHVMEIKKAGRSEQWTNLFRFFTCGEASRSMDDNWPSPPFN